MLTRLRSFLGAWTRRERFEDTLDEEVRFHLEACTEELVRAGVPRREAARRARVQFGGIAGVKDDCRRARGLRLADELERTMTNIRLGFRALFKTPLVTGVAVVSLALGIGANAAIFSLYSQFLLRPLPVAEPGHLVNLESPGPKPGSGACRGRRPPAGQAPEPGASNRAVTSTANPASSREVAVSPGANTPCSTYPFSSRASTVTVSLRGSTIQYSGMPASA